MTDQNKTQQEQKKTILIVEDDPAERELYQEILKKQYNTKTAKNGEQALQKTTPNTDLLILDRKMPGITGDQVLKEIRQSNNQKIKNIPTIMLTALDADLDIINMQFNDYLNKPISPQQLRKKIKETLSVSRYHEDLDEYYSLINKKNVLQEALIQEELTNDEKYNNLKEKIADKEQKINQEITEIMEEIPPGASNEIQQFLEKIIGPEAS
ncbi:hypothetical protein C9439_07225 [archaeon SCG-AAA382B04]|nr:hypothetical protein C9439_07225 [archaeon SCG-AAA382B04]